jgi:molecular chaperone GrpE
MSDVIPPNADAMEEPAAEPVAGDAELERLKAQNEEYLSGWRRAQADYANLKRDGERDRADSVKYANAALLERLLPAIDQYETAMRFAPDLSALPDDAHKKVENWATGLRAVQSLWEATFREVGLERVPTDGAFDPNLHEAVGETETEGVPAGNIASVVQGGWKIGTKLIRPARVIVAK